MLKNFIADFLLRADLLLKEVEKLSRYKELDAYTDEILSANNFMREKIKELNAQIITLSDLLHGHPHEPNVNGHCIIIAVALHNHIHARHRRK